MAKINIFLASSAELKEDRDEARKFIGEMNDGLSDKGHYIRLRRWEERTDTVTSGPTQKLYNQEIEDCEYLICLFFSKAGGFTVQEFEVGLKSHKKTGKPEVYVFFKDSLISISAIKEADINSLFAFQKRLKGSGQYLQWYSDINELKLKLRKLIDVWVK
jgi:hypothetical protein